MRLISLSASLISILSWLGSCKPVRKEAWEAAPLSEGQI